MKNVLVGLVAALSCVSISFIGPAQSASNDGIEQIVEWLDGYFSNQNQVSSGALDAKSNLLFPVFRKLNIPAFGEHVIYLQWPIGSPAGRLQRQRIWTFATNEVTDEVKMDFFTLREPEKWLDAHIDPVKVRGMTQDDVVGYPETCLLPVRREGDQYKAGIPPTCEIISQSTQTSMTLQSEITISADQVTYREAGVRADGSIVFQVPPQGAYIFDRLDD